MSLSANNAKHNKQEKHSASPASNSTQLPAERVAAIAAARGETSYSFTANASPFTRKSDGSGVGRSAEPGLLGASKGKDGGTRSASRQGKASGKASSARNKASTINHDRPSSCARASALLTGRAHVNGAPHQVNNARGHDTGVSAKDARDAAALIDKAAKTSVFSYYPSVRGSTG